jgi:hypothetical protein
LAATQPAPTPNPTPQPISLEVRPGIDPSLAQEVEAAYSLYWTRRLQATYWLDLEPLKDVTTGKELSGSQQYLDELRAQGHALGGQVEHHAVLLSSTAAEALVFDQYEDHSYYIDPVTKAPLEPPLSGVMNKVTFRLERTSEGWKVSGGSLNE